MDRGCATKKVLKPAQVQLILTELPIDCIFHILKWLDADALLIICCVNKLLSFIGSDDSLWRKFTMAYGSKSFATTLKRGFYKRRYCSERKWAKGTLKAIKLHSFRHNNLMPWLQLGQQGNILFATNGSCICSYFINKLMDGEKLDNSAITNLKGHKDDIVRFKKHGKRIYSASMDKIVKVWEIDKQRGQCIGSLEGHHRGVYSVDANRDVIISGSRDQTIKVWSESNFLCLKTIPSLDIVRCLCLNNFKKQFLAGMAAHNTRLPALRVYDLNAGKLVSGMTSNDRDTERLGAGILHLKLEDPNTLLSCGYDTTVRLWDLRMRQCVRNWSDPHDNAVFCFESNRDWMILSGTSRYGVVRQWDKRMSKPCRSMFTASKGSSPVYSLQFTQDGLLVGLSSGIQILKFYR